VLALTEIGRGSGLRSTYALAAIVTQVVTVRATWTLGLVIWYSDIQRRLRRGCRERRERREGKAAKVWRRWQLAAGS